MEKRQQKKRSPLPANVDQDIAIADVSVKISFYHGDVLLDEYDDIIDLEFNYKLEKGGILGNWMGSYIKKDFQQKMHSSPLQVRWLRQRLQRNCNRLLAPNCLKKQRDRKSMCM